MVSTQPWLSGILTAAIAFSQPASSLLDAQKPIVPPAAAAKPLSPETRGDILMARKMYREAVDVYKEAPLDSAVIWNKLGIAYHQMLQLDAAKKYYEQSLKLNPSY